MTNCIDYIETNIGIGESLLIILAITIGGIWSYVIFIKQRQNKALIDFTVDIIFNPKSASLIILHSWFSYRDGKQSHSAEKTMKVPISPEY